MGEADHETIDPAKAEEAMWDAIKARRTGMLGLVDARDHYQPMTAMVEEDSQTIWFFTRDDTDLATAATGRMAMFNLVSKDEQVCACLSGSLTATRDAARIEKFWNPIVAAWYPEGKDDPHLTLLRFDADDARVWLSIGKARFLFEIAKANLTTSLPDEGGVVDLNLR
jgi:general stress protein 26